MIEHPFDPIIDEASKVLILGSFPSIASFETGFYYGHPRNHFWKLMEALFEERLESVEQKRDFLHRRRIALWDVFGIVRRKEGNSSDANLTHAAPNPIDVLLRRYEGIEEVFCNGTSAYNAWTRHFSALHVSSHKLPSSSAANAAMSFAQKLEHYRIIKERLEAL
ncbi:MAG: DNA-deoxyinosine glycosylase [Campylobacterales bacterium]|nr:DNA-deoxyinosine glycosylase [Campylobacterales bacterium]